MGLFKRDADGAKTLVYTGGSSTVLLFVEAAKRRKRLIAGLVVVLSILGGVGFFAFSRYLQAEAAQRVVVGYSDLSRCLIGDPLKAGEVASLRFRRAQLTALTNSDVKRGQKGADPWPDRCLTHALRLQEGLEKSSLGKAKGKELVESTKKLAARLKEKEGFHRDSSALVDGFFAAAQNANLAQVSSTAKPPPKATAKIDGVDELKEQLIGTKAINLSDVSLVPHSGPNLALVIPAADASTPAKICNISASSALCKSLKVDKGSLRLVGTAASGLMPLIAAKSGRNGIFTSSGNELAKGLVVAGHVVNEAYAAALTEDGKGLRLTETGTRRPRTSTLSPPSGLKLEAARRDTTLLWQDVVWAGVRNKALTIATASLKPPRPGIGPARIVAELPGASLTEARGEAPRVDGCRGDDVVLRVLGKRKNYLSFRSGGSWTKPVATATGGGTLSCYGNEASVTRFWNRSNSAAKGSISHDRCSKDGCSNKRIMVSELLASELGLVPADTFHVAASNGKVIVVWLANLRGGLRLRAGSLAELSKAQDRIVFDNLVAGGKVVSASTLVDMRLIPATGFSLLLLNTTKGLALMRVSSEGAVSAIKI